MRRLAPIAALAALCGCLEPGDGDLAWLERDALAGRLAGGGPVTFPAAALLSENSTLCALGSYAGGLPAGHDAAESALLARSLLPTREGYGLMVSIGADGRLRSARTLSVWAAPVRLEVREPLCVPVAGTRIRLRRSGGSLVVGLEPRG